MQRAGVVVGVVDADEVGDGVAEDVDRALGMAARAGRVERLGDLALVEEDLAASRFDRRVGGRVLAFQPFVDLAAGVVVDVEEAAADVAGEGDRAHRHGLRLELLGRPGGRHLVRHHAFGVLLEGEGVDDVEAAAAGHRLERAAEGAVAGDRDLARPGGAQFGAAFGQQLAARAAQPHGVADPVRLVVAGRVEFRPAGAGGAAEADVAGAGAEQDADAAGLFEAPDRGPRVVVAEDEAVALAVLGVAVGAVGAHPDPVAEAAPVDDPVDARRGGGGDRGEARDGGEQGE